MRKVLGLVGLIAGLHVVTCASVSVWAGSYSRYPIIAVDFSFGNGNLSLGDYNLYSGAFLDEAAKKDLQKSIAPDGISVFSEITLAAGYMLTRRLFVGVNMRGGEYVKLSKDLADLVLFGNEVGRTYSLGGAVGEARLLGELQFAYEGKIDSWDTQIGCAVKVVRGFAYGSVTRAVGTLTTTEDEISGDGMVTVVTSQGGTGAGIDLWATKTYSHIQISLCIRDAFTLISWSENSREEINTILLHLNSSDAPSDSNLTTHHEVHRVARIRDRLKPQVSLEITSPWKGWLIRAGYSQTVGVDAFGSGKPSFTFGVSRNLLAGLGFEASSGWNGETGLSQGVSISFGRRTVLVVGLRSSPVPLPSTIKAVSFSLGLFRCF